MLSPRGASTLPQISEGVKSEESGQFEACPVYRAGFANCRMSHPFFREAWHQYMLQKMSIVLLLPTWEGQDSFTSPRQNVESTVVGGELGAVKNAAEPIPVPEGFDDWEVEGRTALNKAGRLGVKRRLHELQ